MSNKDIKTHYTGGQGDNVSVKRAPLTNKLILDKGGKFEMVAGNGFAMPIFRKNDK